MRECISVHVGQAGCQMGNACWELYCLEHGKYVIFCKPGVLLRYFLGTKSQKFQIKTCLPCKLAFGLNGMLCLMMIKKNITQYLLADEPF